MEEKMLIDEDQEDVIQLVQEELGLDESVRPKWYFDVDDLGYSDDESDWVGSFGFVYLVLSRIVTNICLANMHAIIGCWSHRIGMNSRCGSSVVG